MTPPRPAALGCTQVHSAGALRWPMNLVVGQESPSNLQYCSHPAALSTPAASTIFLCYSSHLDSTLTPVHQPVP